MKKSVIAATAILTLFVVASVSVAAAHSAILSPKTSQGIMDGGSGGGGDGDHQTITTSGTLNSTQVTITSPQDGGDDGDNRVQAAQLSVGESITISGLTGQFASLQGNSTGGTASGSLTFAVTGVLQDGVTLSITSGRITFGNTTFILTGGNLVLRQGDGPAIGTGTAGSARLIIQVNGIQASSGMSSSASVRVDLKSGASEFLASLGTPSPDGSSGDSSGD